MSYSFKVRGSDKADAVAKAKAEVEKVASSQSAHEADADAINATIQTYVNLLHDDSGHDVDVVVHGSVWTTNKGLRQAHVSVDVSLVGKIDKVQ